MEDTYTHFLHPPLIHLISRMQYVVCSKRKIFQTGCEIDLLEIWNGRWLPIYTRCSNTFIFCPMSNICYVIPTSSCSKVYALPHRPYYHAAYRIINIYFFNLLQVIILLLHLRSLSTSGRLSHSFCRFGFPIFVILPVPFFFSFYLSSAIDFCFLSFFTTLLMQSMLSPVQTLRRLLSNGCFPLEWRWCCMAPSTGIQHL